MSTWIPKAFSFLLVLACCASAYGQLVADISVQTTSEPDGRLRYEYLIENLPESELTVNAFVLDVGTGADIQLLEAPEGWIGDYDPVEDPFELGWIAQSPISEIPSGGSGSFSFTSPLEPGDILYYIADLAADGTDQGSVLDDIAGPLIAPSAIPGDYDDSGVVEQADLDLVLLNWGQSFDTLPEDWLNERPTGGIVAQTELDNVLLNWGATAGGTDGPAVGGVPEPTGAALLLISMAAVIGVYRCRPSCREPLRPSVKSADNSPTVAGPPITHVDAN